MSRLQPKAVSGVPTEGGGVQRERSSCAEVLRMPGGLMRFVHAVLEMRENVGSSVTG